MDPLDPGTWRLTANHNEIVVVDEVVEAEEV